MRYLRTFVCLVLSVGAVSCDCSVPTAPSAAPAALLAVTVTGKGTLDIGESTPLTATASWSDGTSKTVTAESQWVSDDATVCTVDKGGTATGTGEGPCNVSAVYSQAVGRHGLSVRGSSTPNGPGSPNPPTGPPTGPAVAISLTVSGNTQLSVGQDAQWTAIVFMSDGSQQAVTTNATWASHCPGIAAVGSQGLVSANAPGTCTIQAFYQGLSGVGTVIVTGGGTGPTVTGLTITGNTTVQAGQTTQLQAIAQMSDGSSPTVTAQATWSSGSPGIATVAAGLVTGVTPGSAVITASFGGHTAQATVQVSASGGPPSTPTTVLSLIVTGNTAINVGQTSQLQATAHMSDGTTQNATALSAWVSGTPGVATVSSSGLVTGQGAGQSTVTATFGGKSGQVTMQVTNPAPQKILIGIEVTADSDLTQVALGQLLQLHVYGVYNDGSKEDVTSQATLTPDDPLLRVDGPGTLNVLLTLPSVLLDPEHVVNAQYGGYSANTVVRIKPPVLQTIQLGTGSGPTSTQAGTKFPALQAIYANGMQATLGADFPGVSWQIQPRAGLSNVLQLLGVDMSQVMTVVNGVPTPVNNSLFNQVAGLLGGSVPVETRATYNGVTSNPLAVNITPQ